MNIKTASDAKLRSEIADLASRVNRAPHPAVAAMYQADIDAIRAELATREQPAPAVETAQATTEPEANMYRNGFLNHYLMYVDGVAVAACTGKATKNGEAVYSETGQATCHNCSGAHRAHLGA